MEIKKWDVINQAIFLYKIKKLDCVIHMASSFDFFEFLLILFVLTHVLTFRLKTSEIACVKLCAPSASWASSHIIIPPRPWSSASFVFFLIVSSPL